MAELHTGQRGRGWQGPSQRTFSYKISFMTAGRSWTNSIRTLCICIFIFSCFLFGTYSAMNRMQGKNGDQELKFRNLVPPKIGLAAFQEK
jgi:4-hydroxybenzoate polyprenyltransferase